MLTMREVVLRTRAQVKASADRLDQYALGWEDRIDTEVLDLARVDCCIVGQLFPDASRADYVEDVVPAWLINDEELIFPESLAFDFADEDFADSDVSMTELYSILTEEWVAAINMRRVRQTR